MTYSMGQILREARAIRRRLQEFAVETRYVSQIVAPELSDLMDRLIARLEQAAGENEARRKARHG